MTHRPVALVTGCSSGIGRALALALKESGYVVYATLRSTSGTTPVDDELRNQGIYLVHLDVTDHAQVSAVLAQIDAEQQRLDLLVNNAGFGAIGPLFDLSKTRIAAQFDTNVFSLIELTRQALPLLRKTAGTVVNIGSVSATLVTPFAGAYCASKAAVHAISQAMQMELAPFHIRVLLVTTGAIATGFAKRADSHAKQHLQADSWWTPFQAGVLKRASASQNMPTPAALYAKQLVQAIRKPQCQHVRLGRGVWLLPLLTYLPLRLRQYLLRRQFLLW